MLDPSQKCGNAIFETRLWAVVLLTTTIWPLKVIHYLQVSHFLTRYLVIDSLKMDIPLDSFDSSEKPSHDITTETLPDDTVLIAGGGPVGLILANVLARYGVKSIILERNESTTKLVSSGMAIWILTGVTDGRKWT